MTAIFSFLIGFVAGALINAIGTRRSPPKQDSVAVTRRQLADLLSSGRIDRAVYDSVIAALQPLRSPTVDRALPTDQPQPTANEVIVAEIVPTAEPAARSTAAATAPSSQTTQPTPPLPQQTPEVARQVQRPVEPSKVPVQQRAQTYMQRRAMDDEVETLDAAASEPVEAPKPWSVWFAAFMEEKNIRWGELVGGLLIVSCSIALVISFWEAIAEEPLLKFGVLNCITAALFGVGLHAARRWKLPTTSQGILITATLLVPLNFLAIAALAKTTTAPTVTGLVGEAVSILLFTTLVYLGAKVISTRWSIPLTVGVIVPSVCQLLIRRHVDDVTAAVPLYAFSIACMLAFAVTCMLVVHSVKANARVPERRANEILKHLGIAAFSMFVAIGLLLAKSERVDQLLELLSPLSVLIATPVFLCGTVLWRRPGAATEGLRLAGSGLTVAAVIVLVAGCLAAWPQPALMVALTLFGFVCMSWIALDLKIPEAHVVAAVFLLPAVVLTGNVITGNLTWTGETSRTVIVQCMSALTGRMLTGLAYGGLAASAATSYYLRRSDVALRYAVVCVGSAVIGLLLLVVHGLGRAGDPEYLTVILALHTLTTLAAALITRRSTAMLIAGGMLLVALIQGLQFGPIDFQLNRPWLVTLLVHATSMAAIGVVTKSLLGEDTQQRVGRTAWSWSFGSALLAAIGVVIVIGPNLIGVATDPLTIYLAWLAAIWLVLAVLDESYDLFRAFQLTLALALLAGVDWLFQTQSFYQAVRFGWLHPIVLQCQGIALSMLSLSWLGIRTVLRQNWSPPISPQWRDRLAQWLAPTWLSVDRWLGVIALCMLVALTIYGVVPGIAQELTPISGAERVVPDAVNYEVLGIPHAPAYGTLAWVLLAAVLVTQSISLLELPRRWNLTAVVVAGSTMPLLIASHWTSTVSVASATRWACSIFFMLGSIVIWMRQPILNKLRQAGWLTTGRRKDLQWFSFGLLFLFSSAPLLAMALFVALTAVSIQPPNADQLSSLVWLTVVCLASCVALIATSILPDEKRTAWRTSAGSLAVLGSMPLFAMTLFVVGQALSAHPIVGPNAESVFAQVGLSVSYAIPLVLISVALIGHSISLRAASVALAAGLLLCFSGTAAYLLGIKGVDLAQIEQWLRLAQLNSMIASVYSIGWIAMLRGWLKIAPADADLNWLRTQIGIGVGFFAIPVVALIVHLGLLPSSSVAIHQGAGLWGWTALALALGATAWYLHYRYRTLPTQAIMAAVAGTCAMIALQSQVLDVATGQSWQAFHVLQVMVVAVGGMLIGVERYQLRAQSERPNTGTSVCLLAITGWLVLLGLRGIGGDPTLPWWSMFSLLAAASMAIERGDHLGRQRYLFAAAALINVAVSLWWLEAGYRLSSATDFEAAIDFLCINVVAACVMIPLWLWISHKHDDPRRVLPRIQAAAIWFAMGIYILTVGIGLLADYLAEPLELEPWTNNLALATLVAASISLLWQRRNQMAIVTCYFAGLAATATLLDRLPLEPIQKTWVTTMLVSAFGLGTSYLWSRRQGLSIIAHRLGIPLQPESRWHAQYWLVPLNACLAVVVIALGFWVQLTCDVGGIRLAASQAVAVQAFAMGLLARGRRQTELRFAALMIGVVAAVAFGWSWIDPAGPMATWLNRMVVVTSALMAMAAFYGVGLVKLIRRENQWTSAARQLVPLLVALGTGSVVVVLIGEVSLYAMFGDTAMQWPSILAVALALVVATVACLVAAVVPGRDPLGLSEERRTIYVYAAEALMAILFLHIRVTVPELFVGVFQRYWTLIVMGIAFAGVGLAEWFRRREQAVLSEPLEKTGALLPMLPVIGFWATARDVDYTLLMLLVGMLYAALSVMRRSFGFGVLAALAANGGLWYFLHNTAHIGFLLHPQLWLIPGAICVLAAAYLNRSRLNESQMTTIRYLSTSVIYTSSTADVFINGVGNAPWLPMILAGLSITGIFVGILLRVRAFLFLGLSFLAISLMTVIWHAAVDLQQTWLWYVTGILTGIVIITVFAVFERKRQEVLHLVDRLKSWDA